MVGSHTGRPASSIGRPRATVMAATLVACLGCGGPKDLYPARGRVLHKGQPAAGSVVYFHPQGGTDAAHPGLVPSAVADADGRFRVSSDLLGPGAPAGRYAVLVAWPGGLDERRPAMTDEPGTGKRSDFKHAPVDRLGGRYMDIDKPRFFAEVGPGGEELPPFDLND